MLLYLISNQSISSIITDTKSIPLLTCVSHLSYLSQSNDWSKKVIRILCFFVKIVESPEEGLVTYCVRHFCRHYSNHSSLA